MVVGTEMKMCSIMQSALSRVRLNHRPSERILPLRKRWRRSGWNRIKYNRRGWPAEEMSMDPSFNYLVFLCVREDRHGLQECRIKISRSNGNETRVGSSHLSARKRPTGNFPTIPRGLSSSTAAFFCFFEKRTTEKKRDDRVYYNYQQKSKNKDTTTTLGVPVWSRMLMRTHRYSKWWTGHSNFSPTCYFAVTRV